VKPAYTFAARRPNRARPTVVDFVGTLAVECGLFRAWIAPGLRRKRLRFSSVYGHERQIGESRVKYPNSPSYDC